MSSTPEREWLEERAQPFFITVYRVGKMWQIAVCEAGLTMAERLNPHTVVLMHIFEDRAALLSTNRELLAEVASMTLDLADGVVGARRL